MVATKVDIGAVRSELTRIAALMSEVARQMGPQVWQGGSAANFTIDLRGHSRSLELMMSRILEAATAINASPTVFDVPRISDASPQPSSGALNQVASVSVSGLQRLEHALKRVAADLPGHGRRVRALLAEGGPVEISTSQCTRTAAWCEAQARPMKMRIHYALASDNVGVTGGNINWGMIGIPDLDKFGSGQMTELAKLQARAFSRSLQDPDADGSRIMADIGASLRENQKDVEYLRSFFSHLPAGSVGKLAYHLDQRGRDKTAPCIDDKRVIGDFGTALATLSRKSKNQDAVWHALGAAGSDMPSQGLLVKYGDGRWASSTLAELGKAALRWRQNHQSYTMSWREKGFKEPRWYDADTSWTTHWGINVADRKAVLDLDPALNILAEINDSKDATAARMLALGSLPPHLATTDPRNSKFPSSVRPIWITRLPGQTYVSALLGPDWMDGGKQAGGVINLATQRGTGDDRRAADVARQVVWATSRWNGIAREDTRKFFDKNQVHAPHGIGGNGSKFDLPPALRKDLLTVAIRYLPSFGDSGSSDGDPDTPMLEVDPVTRTQQFSVSQWTAQQFLSSFASDDKERQALLVAGKGYNRILVTGAVQGKYGDIPLEDAMLRLGRLEGNIFNGLRIGFINQGKTEQDAFASTWKDGEQARKVAEGLFGKVPGADLTGALLPELIVSDPQELMSKALKEKIENADEGASTAGHGWGRDLKVDLAVALHNDGTGRDSKIRLDGGKYDVADFFDSKGKLKELNAEQRAILVKWVEKQSVGGSTVTWYQGQAEGGFTQTTSPSKPPQELPPPPTLDSP